MGRGSTGGQYKTTFFDATATLPGEGDTFKPHFTLKTRLAVNADGSFMSTDEKPVQFVPATNRKGEQIVSKDGVVTNRVSGQNYVFATQEDDYVWAFVKPVDELWGEIVGLQVGSYLRNGKTVSTVQLTLRDNDAGETYRIDFRMNHTTRKMFNSLLGLKTLENVSVKITLSQRQRQNNPSIKDNAAYINVWQNGKWEQMSWRFNKNGDVWEDENGLVMPTDDKKASEFLLERLAEVAAEMRERSGDTSEGGSTDQNDEDTHDETASDDLPF